MKTSYYIPIKPDSIPFFNKETKIVTISINGELVEIPTDLFYKIFTNESTTNGFINNSNRAELIDSLKTMSKKLKILGVTKEDMRKQINNSLDSIVYFDQNNIDASKDIALELINEVYDE